MISKICKFFARKSAEMRQLRKECAEIKYGKEGKKKVSTTKKLTFFLFANMTVVELFALYMTYITNDLSVLTVLITPIVGEVIALAVYSIKSAKENTVGGIVYETAMKGDAVG